MDDETYLADLEERSEARFEAFIDSHVRGNLMQCLHCNKWLSINGEWVDPDPLDQFGVPICGECAYETIPAYRKFCDGEELCG